jgi:hypothetical protein
MKSKDGSGLAVGAVAALSAIGFLLGRTAENGNRSVTGSRLWLGFWAARNDWLKTYGESVKAAFRDGREAPSKAIDAWKYDYFRGQNYDHMLDKDLDKLKAEALQDRKGSRLLLTGGYMAPRPSPRDCRRRSEINWELQQEISPERRSTLRRELDGLYEIYGPGLAIYC